MSEDPPVVSPSAAAPLVDANSKKLIKRGRIRDVSAANSLYTGMVSRDRIASRNRARVQSMVDGAPPKGFSGGGAGWYNQDAVAVPNNRETTINWGDGEAKLKEAVAPYVNLLSATENFGTCPIKRDFMDVESRMDWEEIISEEATRNLLAWREFKPKKLLLFNYFKTHGLGFEFHGDEVNWQWDVAGLQDFRIPIKTRIGERNIKYCAVRVYMDPEDLYKVLTNPECEAAGWIPSEVRQAVMDAAPSTPNYTDWEKWEEYWKDNDYLMSEDGNVCPLIYLWGQELDQTLSQYLFREDGSGEFLYKKLGRYGDMSQFVHVYMDNIGTNGKYASIRGLANRLYPKVQTLNRKINSFSDLIDLECCPIFQPSSDVELDTEATEQSGPFTILNPGWSFPDRKTPDYSQSVLPAISMFSSMVQQEGATQRAQYFNPPASKSGKQQAQVEMAQDAQLSDSDMDLYYNTSESWWQEYVRRLCREGYLPVEPGGTEAAEFRRRVVERGVPEEAIYHVDWKSCRINRAIGAGSAQARIVTLDRLEQEAPQFDPVSQQLFVRDKVRAIAGQQSADRYTPKPNARVAPVDAGMAQVENGLLVQGFPIQALPGQNNVVHCQVHLQEVSSLNDQIVQGGEPALVQNIQPMQAILTHIGMHLQQANPEDPQIKQIKQQAQQFDEIVVNGFKHVQKMQDNAAREAAHNSGKIGNQQEVPPNAVPGAPGGVPVDPNAPPQAQGTPAGPEDSSARLATTQAIKEQTMLQDLNYKEAAFQQKLRHGEEMAVQQKKLADLKAATDIENS